MQTALLYLATVLIWGSTWIAIKYQLGDIAPLVSIAHRMAIGALLTLALGALRRDRLRLEPGERLPVLLQGLALFCINYLLIYSATEDLTTGLIAVVFSTMVVLNALGGALFLGMPLSPAVIVGGALGLVGMVGLFLPEFQRVSDTAPPWPAIAWCFAGTVCASAGNLLAARSLRRGLPVLAGNGWGMACGATALYLAALLTNTPVRLDWTPAYLGSLLYLGVFGTVLAFWAYISLIGRIGPDRAAYTSLLFPAVALLLSTWLEGYHWSPWAALGFALVLAGNWLAMRGVRR